MMIEFLTDNNDELAVISPDHIVYVRNDSGAAIVKMTNNETFIISDYDEVLSRLRMANVIIYLDKEVREAAEERETAADDSDEEN